MYRQDENKIYCGETYVAEIIDGVINYKNPQMKGKHQDHVLAFLKGESASAPEEQEEVRQEDSEQEEDKAPEEQDQKINEDEMSDDLSESPVPSMPAIDRWFGTFTADWLLYDASKMGEEAFKVKWTPFVKRNRGRYNRHIETLQSRGGYEAALKLITSL